MLPIIISYKSITAMKNNFRFIATGVIMLVSTWALAQNPPSIVPPSPEAASLGKYGDIPVSTYTGVPNISIPIYEIRARELTVPISLSYHSSGLRASEEASWVGLGWALNAGGVITRSVMGKDDLSSIGFPYQSPTADCNSSETTLAKDCPSPSATLLYNACMGLADTEPDMFYFNFMGKSGKFVLRQTARVFSGVPYDPAKPASYLEGVQLLEEKMRILYNTTTSTWEITMADGTRYDFKVTEKSESWHGNGHNAPEADSNIAFSGNNGDSFVSAWYLVKITSVKGTVINFNYDVDANLNTSYGSKSPIFRSETMERYLSGTQSSCQSNSPVTWTSTANYYSHTYLKSISFYGDSVKFSTSARTDIRPAGLGPMTFSAPNTARKLDAITIRSYSKAIKKFTFSYSNFNNTYTGPLDPLLFKRLKLLSIQESDPGASISKGPYLFTYNEVQPLPSKETYDIDFWGYCNGAGNGRLIPSGTYADNNAVAAEIKGANRAPSYLYGSLGVLTSIQYPTKGTTTFEYELHDYSVAGTGGANITTLPSPVYSSSTFIASSASNDRVKTFSVPYAVTVDLQRTILCWPPGGNPTCSANGFETDIYARLIRINPDGSQTVLVNYLMGTDWITNNSSIPKANPYVASYPGDGIVLTSGTYQLVVQEPANTNFQVSLQATFSSKYSNSDFSGTTSAPQGKPAGGLRIKTITDSDGINPTASRVKRFLYSKTENGIIKSSGKLMMEPNHYMVANIISTFNSQCMVNYSALIGQSSSVFAMGSTAQGNAIGYDQVITLEGLNGENGKTIQKFKNVVENVSPGYFLIAGFPNTSTAMNSNGQLTEETIYDRDGQLMKSTLYTYLMKRHRSMKGLRFISYGRILYYSAGLVFDSCDPNNMFVKYYDVMGEFWVTQTKTERVYDNSDATNQRYLESSSTFSYDTVKHLQMVKTVTTSSKGEVLTTNNVYPGDAADPNRTTNTFMWDDSNFSYKYVHSTPVKTTISLGASVIYDDLNLFTLTNNQVLLSAQQFALNGTLLEPRLSYIYDAVGNIAQVNKANDIPISYLWGYNQTLPLAQILGATYSQVTAAIPPADLTALSGTPSPTQVATILSNLRAALPATQITSFVHDPLVGVVTVIDPNGLSTTYSYDTVQRLINVKDPDGQLLKAFQYNYKN